jgi:biopolymer transport protein TolQ
MNVSYDYTFFSLIGNASFFVQIIMSLLMFASLASWWMIFYFWPRLNQLRRESKHFEREFWSGAELSSLYRLTLAKDRRPKGLKKLFIVGFEEFSKARQATASPEPIITAIDRAMKAAIQKELAFFESPLSWLATIASASPYVGLLGTVWGIMNAFMGLSNTQIATLSAVAPGIAEALIATAIGLFAAIPAVIAYNRLIARLDALNTLYESFADEFCNIIQRQLGELHAQKATRAN